MRFLLGVLGAASLACVVGACAAIAGLGPYSDGECPGDGCDASVHPEEKVAPTIDAPTVADTAMGDDGGSVCDGGTACAAGCLGDRNNCVACGSACRVDQTCESGVCTPEAIGEGGSDAAVFCPDGGCPTPSSTATSFSCSAPWQCNSTSNQCATTGGCFCSNDTQCKSRKCVKVARDNDVSCGSNCTGTGSHDGVDCELASPGIPSPVMGTSSCPANSGYNGTTLSCDPTTHTNCYCTANSQCPNGKCVPSPNNGNCSGCSGTGAADYRGCQSVVLGSCSGGTCPATSTCAFPTCYCTSDVACASGHCIPSFNNLNCAGCTGTGPDDGHGCEPAPSSVACVGTGGSTCTTTLSPPPVVNAGKTACLCVADSNCSSLKCVNKDSQCTGACTGSGPADSEDCVLATSTANAWACSIGNCSNVSSPTGQCTAAGVPCWCTSDSECPGGAQCATWAGCAAAACTASAAGDAGDAGAAFHCVH